MNDKTESMKLLHNPSLKVEWNSFFRFSIAFYCILSLFSFWEDIPRILLQNDLVSDTSRVSVLSSLHSYLAKYGFPLLFDDFVYLVIYAYLFMLGLLCLGAFTRISALFAFLFSLIITKSINGALYEPNYFATLVLFYCIIFPRGKFSMDYYIKEFEINKTLLKWSLYLLQAHLCFIYLFSGIGKSLNIDWQNLSALSVNNFEIQIPLSSLILPDFLYTGIGLFVIIVEIFYPVFINYSKTRKLWLIITIILHIFIIGFTRFYFFGVLMIILNLSAYYIPFLKNNDLDPDLDEESEEQLAY